jgi:signal transduction histidine kinase
LNDSIEELAAFAIAANVTLKATIQVPQPLCVVGQDEQLYRLLANLITNAIQHTPPQGNVIVSLAQEAHHAIIRVQDTGVGIAPDEQSRIFDRFYRIQRDRSRTSGGSGLGLAIVSAIAKAHQGTVHVESQLGQGSTFTVRLPLM